MVTETGTATTTMPRVMRSPHAEPWDVLAGLAAVWVVVTRMAPAGAIFDQAVLLSFSLARLPRLTDGFTSSFIAALVNTLTADRTRANLILRSVAAVFYVGAHQMMIARVTKRRVLRVTLLAAVILTPSPFLWLSSELFASGFLALTIWAVMADAPVLVLSACLVAFAFTKSDTLLPAAAMAAMAAMTRESWPERAKRFAFSWAWLPVILVPGLVIHGWPFFSMGARSFTSFQQHYAELISRHQFGTVPDPWRATARYTAVLWPGVDSVGAVIWTDWHRYLDFVALSLSRSVQDIIRAGLLPLAAAAWFGWRSIRQTPAARVVAVALVGFVPQILVAYVHVRYTLRARTILVVLVGLAMAAAANRKDRRALALLVALTIATVLWTAVDAFAVWQGGYWFPD